MSVDMIVPVRPAGSAVSFLRRAALRRAAPLDGHAGGLQFGIDLGTATIVLCAVDRTGEPVYWDNCTAQAVRDGVVVDFQGAVSAVRDLVEQAEAALGVTVDEAGTAFPPGVPVSDCRACRYVIEQAGVRCRTLVDEVSAAQALLRVDNGAIVDVGGGSTGVGLFRDGELKSLTDRPGGGHHLDLILAGALGISIEEAEHLKRTDGSNHVQTLLPGIERIAESVLLQCDGRDPGELHLAGGALMLPGAAAIITGYLDWTTVAYPHAELITPFGIAVS
jgi:ethanolamine utilization protein EutJ